MTIYEKLEAKGDILGNRDLVDIGLYGTMMALYGAIEGKRGPKSFKLGIAHAYHKKDVRDFLKTMESYVHDGGVAPYVLRAGYIKSPGYTPDKPHIITKGKYVKSGKYSKFNKLAPLPHPHVAELNTDPIVVNIGNLINHQFDTIKQSIETIKSEWRLDHDLLNQVRKECLDLRQEKMSLNQSCTDLHNRVQHLENELGVKKQGSLLSRLTNAIRG